MSARPAAALAATSLAVVLAGVFGGRFADAALALAACAFPPLLLAGWAESRSRPVLLRVVIGGLALLLGAAGVAVIALAGSRWSVVGLPVTAWCLLVGFVLAPLVLAAWGHAKTFDEPPRGPRDGA